jgi:hypothetical protein
VGEVDDRTGFLGVQERYTPDQGLACAHVPAAYGARENQDVGLMFFPNHGGIILGVTKLATIGVCASSGALR